MIQSVQELPITLASNSASLTFLKNDVRSRRATCCGWLQHEEGSPSYKILEGGTYKVSFNANVTSATAGPVALALYEDGVIVPGTTVIAQVVTAGNYYNVSFDKLIKLCCKGNSTLTINAVPSILSGVPAPGIATVTQVPIVQNANLSIIKKS